MRAAAPPAGGGRFWAAPSEHKRNSRRSRPQLLTCSDVNHAPSFDMRLTFAVAALLLVGSSAAFEWFPETSRNGFFGQEFWRRFNQGFKHLEAAMGGFEEDSSETDVESTEDKSVEDVSGPDFQTGLGFPGGIFDVFSGGSPWTSRGPWWRGPNVCVEREEIDESEKKNKTSQSEDQDDGFFSFGTFQSSTCQENGLRYVCTTKIHTHGIHKTVIVKYQCCHGFMRLPDKPGCTEVNLKSLMDTMNEIGSKDFVELVRSAGLEEKLSMSNLTVFSASDEAVRDFSDSMQEANQVEFYIPSSSSRRRRDSAVGTSMKEVVLGHVVSGFHDINELRDEQLLYSDNDNKTIRINFYRGNGERIITANCARVTSMNNYASNGIVHVVDKVIRPVGKSLAELISEDEQFHRLKSLAEKTSLMKKLSEPGHYTLFAPTDSAFDKLEPAIKDRLFSGESCLENVLRHHIVPHSICSAAITSRANTINLGETVLKLEQTPEDTKFFVDGIQIVVRDIIATNGILHVIDEVILPDAGKPVSSILESHNLTSFLGLIREAGLLESLDAMNNVTLFAATDEALADPKIATELEKLKADKDKLRDVLMYHTTGPEVHSCDFTNNQELKTGLADRSVKINLYTRMPVFSSLASTATVQCARMVRRDDRACSGVVHEIDRLLIPPTQTIEQFLKESGNFSKLLKLIEITDMSAELKENAPVTLLAPTDAAFQKLDEEDLNELMENKELATRILKQHVLPEALCCAGVMTESWPFTREIKTLAGNSITLRRSSSNKIHVGTTTVKECDQMATNGIVQVVNRVMIPQVHTIGNGFHMMRNPNVEVLLYGL